MEQMKTSEKGIALIRAFEGCVLKAYKCPAGIWTIGYGHTRGVKSGDKIDKTQAENFLIDDIRLIESRLSYTFSWLSQNQFDALVSFIFNVGWEAFHRSTLYRHLVEHASDRLVCENMLRWCHANKKPLLGLMKRRVAEANMWMGRQAYQVQIKNNRAEIVIV